VRPTRQGEHHPAIKVPGVSYIVKSRRHVAAPIRNWTATERSMRPMIRMATVVPVFPRFDRLPLALLEPLKKG